MTTQKQPNQAQIEEVHVDPGFAGEHPDVVDNMVNKQYRYSTWGLGLGLVCIVGGIVLFLLGITGNIGWSVKVLGFESKLTDAAPGALLFVVGVIIIWATRFSITVQGKKKK